MLVSPNFPSTDALLDVKEYELRIRNIREQAVLWFLERPEEYDDVSAPISTQRVCTSQMLIYLSMSIRGLTQA